MGLSVLAFIAALGIAWLFFVVTRRGIRYSAGPIEVAIGFCLFFFAVFQGVTLYLFLHPSMPETSVFFQQASLAARACAEILMVGFALAFPRWAGRWAKFIPILLVGAAGFAVYYVFAGPDYITGWLQAPEGFTVAQGPAFRWVNLGMTGFGALAAAIHLIRAIRTDDSINRQRSLLTFAGVVLGVALLEFYSQPAFDTPGAPWPLVAPTFGAFALAWISSYATSVTRLFDWRQLGRTVLAYAVLTLVVGLPAIAIVILLAFLGRGNALIPIVGTPLVFAVAFVLGRRLEARFAERLGARGEYREMLESALAHVDLSAGRDAVLEELYSILSEDLGFTDLGILIEDDRGVLKTAYTSSGAHATLDKSDPVRSHIERSDADVLMLSEAQSSPEWEPIQKELLALFGGLKAESLIIAREGRRIIGVFAIGARKTGGEYTDYDYDTFKAIAGKLFVFAFYLKNVARESILYTVDRELALSDQIIRFALEHVASVDNPHADAAWAMKSTRSLGGDFVDFIRIGRQRWFFVLGDVSGKGLSASMNMLILKSMVRTFLKIEKDFAGLVQRVNAFIKDYLPKGSFFAGVFGYFDFEKGNLYFINCGVPAALLYSPSFDAFIEVQGEGKVLGFVRDVTPFLKPRKLSLSPGTALVLCTDGLLDSENIRGERFGKERLRKAARDRLDKPARAVADGVIEDLLKFTENKQEDDITLLVMKIK
jgi:hypothetical protein